MRDFTALVCSRTSQTWCGIFFIPKLFHQTLYKSGVKINLLCSYIRTVLQQELCTGVMAAQARLLEGRNQVHGERVHVKALTEGCENALSYKHTPVVNNLDRISAIDCERKSVSPGWWVFWEWAVCPDTQHHGEESCPTRSLEAPRTDFALKWSHPWQFYIPTREMRLFFISDHIN